MALYLWIALGGALGSVARFALSGWVAAHTGEAFPWGTLIVNVAGSFIIGLFAAVAFPEGRFPVAPAGRHFFMTGVLGGFTTFSSFSLQTLMLARAGAWGRAAGNVTGSVLLCLGAVWLGYWIGSTLSAARGT